MGILVSLAGWERNVLGEELDSYKYTIKCYEIILIIHQAQLNAIQMVIH